jgi:nucleotide-binding universal stress UspA family protein
MSEHGPILVPLDGSDLGEQAVPVAAALARRTGAELHLVHVHVPLPAEPISVEGLPVIDEHMRSRRREHEQAYLDGARARLASGASARIRVLDGAVAPALAAHARASNAQLLVLTTHGRGGLERAWLGSVADEMSRLSPVPILLVRPEPGTAPAPFRRILVPLDGSPLAEAILDHAIRIARLEPEAEIVLLDVVQPIPSAILVPQSLLAPAPVKDEVARAQEAAVRKYLEGVAGRVRSAHVRAQVRVDFAGNVAAAILEAARAEGADLVALCTHGRSGLPRIALGSVADKIVRASVIPVLLFRPPTSAAGSSARE